MTIDNIVNKAAGVMSLRAWPVLAEVVRVGAAKSEGLE